MKRKNLLLIIVLFFCTTTYSSNKFPSWTEYVEKLCEGLSQKKTWVVFDSEYDNCLESHYHSENSETWKEWQWDKFVRLSCKEESISEFESCISKTKDAEGLKYNWKSFYNLSFNPNSSMMDEIFNLGESNRISGLQVKNIPRLYLNRLLLKLEEKLESKSGIDFVCGQSIENCINSYNHFLLVDKSKWNLAREKGVKSIFHGDYHNTSLEDGFFKFNPNNTDDIEYVQRILGFNLSHSEVSTLSKKVSQNKTIVEKVTLNDLDLKNTEAFACKDEKFKGLYDQLYSDGLSLSLFLGYKDYPSLGGKTYDSIEFGYTKIAFERTYYEMINLGFELVSSNETEAHLQKKVLYKG